MMAIVAIIIFLVYAYIGYKLKHHPVAWGFIGLGVLITLPLLGAPFLLLIDSPSINLAYWAGLTLLSVLFAALVAFYIAYT
jgi:hypothetical protein